MKRRPNYKLSLLVILGCIATLPLQASSDRTSRVVHQAYLPEGSLSAEKDTVNPSNLRIAIISYWFWKKAAWGDVPNNSLVLINPNSGILDPDSDHDVKDWSDWVEHYKTLKKKDGVTVLGYVFTGYFDHASCKGKHKCPTEARIRRQVEEYYRLMPNLDGIFYDATAPLEKNEATANYDVEYEMLRSTNKTGRITVFNVGKAEQKAVDATKPGEHLVLFERDPTLYEETQQKISDLSRLAHEKGIVVWHLLHTVPSEKAMCSYVTRTMAERFADYGYVTDFVENNKTWDNPPTNYWKQELAAFLEPGKPCAK